MYRLTSVILSLLLTVSLAACGGTGENFVGGRESDSPEASLSGAVSGEITVSAYDSMRTKSFLEEAAQLFEEKYPGTKVNVETFSAMPEIRTSEQGNMRMQTVQLQDDPQGRQDYVNRVNTAMMGGKGADILAMDVLPAYKYADSGQLENLADYMEADPEFNRAGYRENILDAISYKGGLWFLPLNYSFEFYAYDSTLISGESASGFGADSAFAVGELIALGEPAFDGSSKLFNTFDYIKGAFGGGGSMWSSLFKESYGSFVDVENKKSYFDDGRFAELLQSVKTLGERGYINQGVTGQTDMGEMMRRSGESPTDRYFFKSKNTLSLLNQYTRDLGIRMNIMMAGNARSIEDDDEIAGIAANADGSIPFTYGQAYAINANSQNKDTAWAFLRFLLSDEMQLSTNIMSPAELPLNNSARAKHAESILGGAFGPRTAQMRQQGPQGPQGPQQPAEPQSGQQGEQIQRQPETGQQDPPQIRQPEEERQGGQIQRQPEGERQNGQPQIRQPVEPQEPQPLDEKQLEALAMYNDTIERLSDKINTYVFEDAIVNDMITSEAQNFFDGSKSADEVAKALQSKVSLYLSENG